MKRLILAFALLLPSLLQLTAASQAPWETLFDGKSIDAWRSYNGTGFPAKGWKVENGALRVIAGGGGGDIVSRQQYANFELTFEWKVSPGANSGVMYRVQETKGASYETGPEYQVLDDSKHADGKNPKTSSGALYALIAPNQQKKLKPVGEWNSARIVVDGVRAQHWLNGSKVVEYQWAGVEVGALIKQSKFKDWAGFAQQPSGHICLQDHGDDVWYRKIRIRRLAANGAEPNRLGRAWKPLFDGRTTDGWRGFGKTTFPAQGWVVEDGWLRHIPKAGGGDIITRELFDDFEFEFEWKIAKGGNSGVKYFIDEKRGSPIGHEYQVIDDGAHPDAAHGPKRQTAALYDALPPVNAKVKPPGEINVSRIVVKGMNVEHWLNGGRVLSFTLGSPELEKAKAMSKFKGEARWGTKFATPILLQDHQDEVWYRNMRIRKP